MSRLETAMAELASTQKYLLQRLAEPPHATYRLTDYDRQVARRAAKSGLLTEWVVEPNLVQAFEALFGEPWTSQAVHLYFENPTGRGFDAVVGGQTAFLAVDVFSARVNSESADRLVEALSHTRGRVPGTTGCRAFGALACFDESGLVELAEPRGLLAFGLANNRIDVLNSPGFQPRSF